MAEDIDLDGLDVKPSGSSKKLIITILVVMLLSIGGTVVVMMSMLGGSEQTTEEAVKTEEKAKDVEDRTPLFVELDKLLVNFQGEGKAKMLAANLSILTYDEAVKNALVASLPRVRSEVIFLLREQKFSQLETDAGAAAMRDSAIEKINKIVQNRLGDDSAKIEGVYFTRFVTQ